MFQASIPAEYSYVERLTAALAGCDAIPVAVRSGTINDVTKLAAGCPVEPEPIGTSRPRLRDSYEQAYYIRRRYTVLDFATRAGRLIPTTLATLIRLPWMQTTWSTFSGR